MAMLESVNFFYFGLNMYETWKDVFNPNQSVEISLAVDQHGKLSDQDLQVACAVLLVEMARADKQVAPEEGAAVVKLMSTQFGIAKQEVPKLIEIAVAACKTEGGADALIASLNERLNEEQRVKLMGMVWRVVLADKTVEEQEEKLAEKMRRRLKLSETLADDARYMAEQNRI